MINSATLFASSVAPERYHEVECEKANFHQKGLRLESEGWPYRNRFMSSEVTRLLHAAEAGDAHAAEELLPIVYDQLRRLAAAKMAAQPPGHTLQATALVHEAWLRIAVENHRWENRRHFFGAAAEAMRRILVDRARAKKREKRGGGWERISLEAIDIATETEPEHLLRVHEAMERLAAEDALKAELIKLRYFVGLRISEAAEILGISETTAKRHWAFARAWLYDELRSQPPDL